MPEHDSMEYLKEITAALWAPIQEDLDALKNITGDLYFFEAAAAAGLLPFADILRDVWDAERFALLVEAYRRMGSTEGFIALCRAFFGYTADIEITIIDNDEEHANAINVKVEGARVDTWFARALSESYAYNLDGMHAYAYITFSGLFDNDPLNFFRQFLPNGVIINTLSIG
jgi:hypothetical protein